MNRRLFSLPILIAAFLLCFSIAHAQQISPATNDKSANAELREKAFNLLASLADQIATLQSGENRARIGSNIAGSLWTHDEKRARSLFRMVEDEIRLGLQVERKAPSSEYTFQVFLKLREDTAARMAQHDPELAIDFVRNTASLVYDYARNDDGRISPDIIEHEKALELNLAKLVSTRNPERAVKLARESLANGFSRDLLTILRHSSKDKTQATMLYKEIVAKLRETDLLADWEALNFAITLTYLYTPPTADEATYRELNYVLVTKMLAARCGQPLSDDSDRMAFCRQLSAAMPVLQNLYPAETSSLRQWRSEPGGNELETYSARIELDELAENGTIEEILSLTSKYPAWERAIRFRAIFVAEQAGDLDQVQKIADAYSADPELRQAMDKRVEYYKKAIANIDQAFAEMQRMLGDLPPKEQILHLYNSTRGYLRLDKKMALKAATQLSALVDALPPGKEQAEYQVELAAIFCQADSDRGFAIIEAMLPTLNELIAASAKLDGYEARYLRDGEWNMSAASAVGNILTILANNAGYFAWYDFDRAVTLSGQFQRSEIRMMAQLKLAQGILSDLPNRTGRRRSPVIFLH